MSWDLDLIDDRGHCEAEANGTHNINLMVEAALAAVGYQLVLIEGSRWDLWRKEDPERRSKGGRISWWEAMDGMTGPAGAELLQLAADEMEANPATYDAMNPPNGWGSREIICGQLRDLIRRVPEWPCSWKSSG